MALTRAQLLMGNSSQGTVLAGQVQGVRQGPGITINTDGTIEVNSQTVVGLMKLGQTPVSAAAAYNQYEWPTSSGTVDQQLTIDAISGPITTLKWKDPDLIPWTAKGQLVVGTGVTTQTLLNVGTDGQILIADSAAASGLSYSSNYVSTTGPTGVANMPAGSTGTRPATPSAGGTRYNSTTTSLEFWNGTSWETVASSGTNSFVEKTSDTGSAVMPAGTTLQRDAAPAGGFLRFNSTTAQMEFWNGTSWQSVASSATGIFVEQTLPTGPAGATANAVIPAGTTAQRQTAPASAAGNMRYNSTTASLEYFDGTNWVGVKGGIPDLGLNLNATNSLLKASTPVTATPPTAGIAAGQAIDGSMYWDSQYGAMFVRYADGTSTQWVMVNGNNVQTGTLNFPDTPVGGNTYAAPNGLTYTYDGTKGVWTCPAGAQVGLGLATNGGFIKVSLPIASTPPTTGTGQAQAMDGSIYWDSTLGQLFIRYNDGVTTQWVAAAPPGGGGGGGSGTVTSVTGTAPIVVATGTTTPAISITDASTTAKGAVQLATAAEAATGTDALKALTPATGVPKDASGMTGAALLPTGTQLQRPATPVAGMLRMNTTLNPDSLEAYDGTSAAWRQIAYVPTSTAADLTYSASQTLNAGVYVCKNLTVNAGVVLTGGTGPVIFQCYGNVVINGTINLDGCGGYGGPATGPWGAQALVSSLAGFGFGAIGKAYPFTSQNYGSGGWAATVQTGAPGASITSTPAGGSGGGGIVILSQGTLTIGASAVMSANGNNCVILPGSLSGEVFVQGAGGGSGGLIQLESFGNMTLAGTLSVTGGNGSAGVESGGFVGGGARGGGGGGGGVIYIKCSNGTLTDTSSKTLTGGTGGATASITGPAGFGQNGAGFGGAGGAGGLNTPPGVGTAAQPGGAGVVIIG